LHVSLVLTLPTFRQCPEMGTRHIFAKVKAMQSKDLAETLIGRQSAFSQVYVKEVDHVQDHAENHSPLLFDRNLADGSDQPTGEAKRGWPSEWARVIN
jgi:hypothetical protein